MRYCRVLRPRGHARLANDHPFAGVNRYRGARLELRVDVAGVVARASAGVVEGVAVVNVDEVVAPKPVRLIGVLGVGVGVDAVEVAVAAYEVALAVAYTLV